jgi:DegV family protein with EDD domain
MVVKVVTDSSSDIPSDIAQVLDIKVVPFYVRFGNETFRDGVDISPDEFYYRLEHDRVRPQTSTPAPGDYADTYNRLATEADAILSIHLSPRYSSAINAARLAVEYVNPKCRIAVVDSKSVSMGCGLAAMAAARTAGTGSDLETVIRTAHDTIGRAHIIGMISDIKYLLGGSRLILPGAHILLGKLGTIFRYKLVGEIYEAGRIRGRGMYFNEKKALNKMERCVIEYQKIEEVAVLHAMKPEWDIEITKRLNISFPETEIYESRLSGATGIHGGPKAIAIAFTTDKKNQEG